MARYFLDECAADIDQITEEGKTLSNLARDFNESEMLRFLSDYRFGRKTEQTIQGALPAGRDAAPLVTQSRSLSPL